MIKLPPRIGGELSLDNEPRRILIIGANGSGKTRFARRMAHDAGEGHAFRQSALKAIYGLDIEDDDPASIDALYHRAVAGSTLVRDDIRGEFNRLIALMINEEIADTMSRKYLSRFDTGRGGTGATDALPPSRLDRMVTLWQQVFPDNRVLIECGRMLIGRHDAPGDTYSAARLSNGEMAVMYHIGAALYAPEGARIFVDAPEMFLYPGTVRQLWDSIERLRADCTFVYVTHDLDFAATRSDALTLWVRAYAPERQAWDYHPVTAHDGLSEEAYMAILGARKPVLFVEGDGVNSLDSKLYRLVFSDCTLRPLGSCDRVIEATRSFNSTRAFHNLDARGIVDRDRRDAVEVRNLRSRNILVPEVAEIENIFLLEGVVRAVATHFGRNANDAFRQVKRSIMRLFEADLRSQALEHTRHRIKRTVAIRIDGRFTNINMLEQHIDDLARRVNPRGLYEELCREFHSFVAQGDYASVMRVYNRKSMLTECHVARACGLPHDDKDSYIRTVLGLLDSALPVAAQLRDAVREAFCIDTDKAI